MTAEAPVEVFILDRDALAPILDEDPAIAELLSQRLAERSAATSARIEDKRSTRSRTEAADQVSLLRRIRGFFKLGTRG